MAGLARTSRTANVKTKQCVAIALCVLFSRHGYATQMNLRPELAGLSEFAVVVSAQNLPGLESAVTSELKQEGMRVRATAPVTLGILIEYQENAACPDLTAVQVNVSLSQNVRLLRGRRSVNHEVTFVQEREAFLAPRTEAADRSQQMVLDLVRYLCESSRYATAPLREKK